MVIDDIPADIHAKYEIHEWRHAVAILRSDFPNEWNDLTEMLRSFRILPSWIQQPGGHKSEIAVWLDKFLSKRGWTEKGFSTAIRVDNQEIDTPTHKVDCFRNGVALELEWNNKDPFFDRDLNNFRLLFDL